MNATWKPALIALIAVGLAACSEDTGNDTAGVPAAEPPAPPSGYEPHASVLDLMRSTVTFSAETYWESVMIVWDENGETIHQPEDDLEWQEVWAAGITLAEAGNLLMLPRVGYPDDPQWNQFAQQLKDAGIEAAETALRQDYFEVLDAGNVIYNACVACHEVFIPTLQL